MHKAKELTNRTFVIIFDCIVLDSVGRHSADVIFHFLICFVLFTLTFDVILDYTKDVQ